MSGPITRQGNTDTTMPISSAWELTPVIGRSSQDPGMVRLQHARVSLQGRVPPEDFFNAYSRWASYEHWAPDIQGAGHWLVIREGGVGSQFILYDKPGPRNLVHFGIVSEIDPGRHFAWRAPFAEWEKVFIGTSLYLSPRSDGSSHAYHVIWVDLPREYLPTFAGFGTLPGLDIEFETWHVQEEIRGFNELLRAGGFSDEHHRYLFDDDQVLARDWPTVNQYASTEYWAYHPELHAALQTGLGLLNLLAIQFDRSLEASNPSQDRVSGISSGHGREPFMGSPPGDTTDGYREFLKVTHGRNGDQPSVTEDAKQMTTYWGDEAREFAEPVYWSDKQLLQATIRGGMTLLSLFTSQVAQATTAAQNMESKNWDQEPAK